jgi:hypothetical protein
VDRYERLFTEAPRTQMLHRKLNLTPSLKSNGLLRAGRQDVLELLSVYSSPNKSSAPTGVDQPPENGRSSPRFQAGLYFLL